LSQDLIRGDIRFDLADHRLQGGRFQVFAGDNQRLHGRDLQGQFPGERLPLGRTDAVRTVQVQDDSDLSVLVHVGIGHGSGKGRETTDHDVLPEGDNHFLHQLAHRRRLLRQRDAFESGHVVRMVQGNSLGDGVNLVPEKRVLRDEIGLGVHFEQHGAPAVHPGQGDAFGSGPLRLALSGLRPFVQQTRDGPGYIPAVFLQGCPAIGQAGPCFASQGLNCFDVHNVSSVLCCHSARACPAQSSSAW